VYVYTQVLDQCLLWDVGVTGGHVLFLMVNVTYVDFVVFAFIRHFNKPCSMSERCACNFCEAVTGFWSEAIIAISSANVAISVPMFVGKSAV
jgi:hypothetical protein